MHIVELRLFGFRGHQELRLRLDPGLTVIHGQNGQGKTTLLEGIAVLALTRSPLTSSQTECLAWGAPAMRLTTTVARRDGAVEVDLRWDRDDTGAARLRRRYRVDGQPRPARAVLGTLRVVCFWPDDLGLVKGPASGRRRLLDVAISQGDPAYAEAGVRYRRALDQRNAALRQERTGGSGSGHRAFDAALIQHGSVLVAARAAFVAGLAPLAATALVEIGETAPLQLAYRPQLGPLVVSASAPLPTTRDQAAERIRAGLTQAASAERARGQTLVGPHRDEVEVTLGARPARAFASQGQQRSIVLAVKVAEVRHHQGAAGEQPVLLLDDVLSELDAARQRALLGVLAVEGPQLQTLLTVAGDGPALLPGARHLRMEAGRVIATDPDAGGPP
ncbi:MAG TPA: DNA replication/repair protein RecF [Verrucomicrobiae bacterium]|nr:DNA replication/repair protein RecF [Verrucomicrobiae bacterium]